MAAAVPPAVHDCLPRMDSPRVESASVDGSHPWDLDLDQVLGNLYPDSRQRGAVVAELETLTYLHQSLVQQTATTEYLTHLEQRIFQLLGMA
ncbi:hypothetical protein OOK60_13915 [Trichothermofontia sichuanensis B231]|uniref:hypothetical protein n=1 Tax=Trichothermofontia sichuanensis TaxID=3045816 RepID=UPI0022485485|nr:hypothetical protein [Trichothermofontia sichuanensis]UZQ53585.1 hypothetical protein OOK60_13915 [Trichothermofontia sichuanensis B231]